MRRAGDRGDARPVSNLWALLSCFDMLWPTISPLDFVRAIRSAHDQLGAGPAVTQRCGGRDRYEPHTLHPSASAIVLPIGY